MPCGCCRFWRRREIFMGVTVTCRAECVCFYHFSTIFLSRITENYGSWKCSLKTQFFCCYRCPFYVMHSLFLIHFLMFLMTIVNNKSLSLSLALTREITFYGVVMSFFISEWLKKLLKEILIFFHKDFKS